MMINGDFYRIQAKDHLEFRGYKSFFDVDNLHTVTIAALTEAVQKSCAIILFLDDETTQSSWSDFIPFLTTSSNLLSFRVVHELQTAKQYSIPIITVIDIVSEKREGICYFLFHTIFCVGSFRSEKVDQLDQSAWV
jgi:hypothetical protein